MYVFSDLLGPIRWEIREHDEQNQWNGHRYGEWHGTFNDQAKLVVHGALTEKHVLYSLQ